MDAGAFVQENKRWLVGCAIGGLVWLIASSVINSVWSASSVNVSRKGAPTAVYDNEALGKAEEESRSLQAERDRLQKGMSFAVDDRYAKWTGPADQHLFLSGRTLRQTIVDSASDRDVLAEASDVVWDVPNGIDQIRRVLYGLDMIDEIQRRMFAAHDRVRAQDEEAVGLVAINSIKLETDRRRNLRRGRGRRRGVQIEDLLQQQRVSIQFQSDAATLAAFLEACRQPNRTLIVDQWQASSPARPGEPCTVKATLAGISFLDS